MNQLLTPKQVARAIGVSESSLKRWCDKGLLETIRTAGGHRRLNVSSVLAFLRETGQRPVRPEILGLPTTIGLGEAVIDRAGTRLFDALSRGDEEAARQICFDLYLAGHRAHEICDRVIRPVFFQIGECWECGELEVFEEHRACEIGLRLLYELRSALPTVRAESPVAIGGTPAGDPYRVATTMVEIALREAGWKADSLGPSLPVETLVAAIERTEPRLFWLSISAPVEVVSFATSIAPLLAAAERHGATMVLGGRGATTELRTALAPLKFCDDLTALVDLAGTLALVPARIA